jgi:hypothetical protein
MKSMLLFFLAITGAAGADAPPSGKLLVFSTISELETWATNSAAGGRVDIAAHETNRVALVRRSFTGGVESCDLRVFRQRGERWQEALRLAPYWNYRLEYAQNGDWIVVSAVGYSGMRVEVARFSISGLCLQDYPVQIPEAEPVGAASGSRPNRSETNQTPSAVGSRR